MKTKAPKLKTREGQKRRKVHSVKWLERQLASAKTQIAMLQRHAKQHKRMSWLRDNAHKEIHITRHAGGFEVIRWHRRYLSFHGFHGETFEQAIDAAQNKSLP